MFSINDAILMLLKGYNALNTGLSHKGSYTYGDSIPPSMSQDS